MNFFFPSIYISHYTLRSRKLNQIYTWINPATNA